MSTQKIRWLDAIKGLSILWIIACHLTEALLGTPCFGFPSVHWPPPSERFAQLLPMDVEGLWGIFLNALRYVGWLGNQGVQVFIVASGFGLMWSHLHKAPEQGIDRAQFFRRRVLRIYPMWVLAHLGFGLLSVAARHGFWLTKGHFWLSLVGIRFTSSSFFVLAPAWWFIPLLLQLYILFPYLIGWVERMGINRFFVVSAVVSLSVRAAGLYLFSDYLLPWSTGAIFITRLPEFTFGIWLAWHMKNAPESLDRGLRSGLGIAAAGFIYLLGTFASFFLFGAIFSKLLTAGGLFCLLYVALSKLSLGGGLWAFVGKHSYSLYLAHHPFISFLIRRHLPVPPVQRTLISVAAALTATVVTAFILEVLERTFLKAIESKAGLKLLVRRMRWVGILGCAGIASLFGVELLFRAYNPQEILGWGERTSLQKHDEFGYNLIPGKTTRLRWESYDYVVQANRLGFPGPAYSESKDPGVLRILVTGDAFTSAEGVDTDKAWPRVLERMLREGAASQRAEVMNFAITGWGPLEYLAVVEKYAPKYKPDVIVVAFFVNDFHDVFNTHEQMQSWIGFDGRSQHGLYSLVTLQHTRAWVRWDFLGRMKERIKKEPYRIGFSLGHFGAFERKELEALTRGQERIQAIAKQLKAVSQELESKLIFLLVPASIQINGRSQLDYYPRVVEFSDGDIFDTQQPQKLMRAIADGAGVAYLDLYGALKAQADKQVYMPRNMHWTKLGHRIAAEAVHGFLLATLKGTGEREGGT